LAHFGPQLLSLDDKRWDEAHEILESTPIGSPVLIAEYLLSDQPAKWIQAWPADYANPLIVLLFSATNSKPVGDTTPWCAAFVNWCLMRAGLPRTNKAGSQSFVGYGQNVWKKADGGLPSNAQRGDIAVFRHRSDPVHGHVAFFEAVSTSKPNSIEVVGGNQIVHGAHVIDRVTMRVDPDLELIEVNTETGLRVDK